MQWTAEQLAAAADRLDDALADLRTRPGAEALDYFGDAGDELPGIRAQLLSGSPDFGHGVTPVFGLLLLQACRLALPADALPRYSGGDTVQHPTVWLGDVRIPGDLTLRAPLVVLGSLTVDGLLDDGDVDESYLAVAGDLQARAISSAADHFVLGTIAADVIFCFNNDGSLVTGQDLVADLFVPAEHAYECHGELRARPLGEGYRTDVVAEQVAPWLPEDYIRFGGTEPVDARRVLTEAAAGHSPVLRQPRPVRLPVPRSLVAAMEAPTGVTELDLSGERLHVLPERFAALTELVRLNVEHTPLGSLAGIGAVPTLRWLSIRKTPALSLSPLLTLPDLAYLDVSYCTDVEDWPVLVDLPALEKVVAHGCPLPPPVRTALSDRLGPALIGQ